LQLTKEIAAGLGEAETIYLADFTGLSVEALGELRGRLRESGAQFRVVKNTLTIRALEGLDLPDLTEHLKGPTGLVLAGEDPAGPARIMRDFARENDDRPVVKVGIVDKRTVAADEIRTLADLPSRAVLLGTIAGGLTASVAGIVGSLNAVIRDIAFLVEEVAKRKDEQN
ncbi:MAG: 50S ribosomal protein L10, partial [Gemmatimonadota bacterium]|nr:50S ribosomal protein L10 [Gemmatimonadota bacterium]